MPSPRTLDLGPAFEAVAQPLELIEDPERRDVMRRYLVAGRPHLERAVFDLLAEVTTAVSQAGGNVRARLEYAEGKLHVAVDVDTEEADEPLFGVEGGTERLTLRLPARLKEMIDRAAATHGTSANAWCVRALYGAVFRQARGRPPADLARVHLFRGRGRRRPQDEPDGD